MRFTGLPKFQVLQNRFDGLPPHDCFVTAGNAFGIMTAGIDAAVVAFFGEDLMRRIQHRILEEYLGEQPVGTAFLIDTGHDERPYLVHAPTMRVPCPIEGTDKVYTATWAALLAVNSHNQTAAAKIKTLAMPAMGTGFGRMSFDEAARQMAAAYRCRIASTGTWSCAVKGDRLRRLQSASRALTVRSVIRAVTFDRLVCLPLAR
jgi:O-acetyl-ADP-ribose deacetylase (regulator of RNase III)